MLNKQYTMGRFSADPELKKTPGGTSFCNFTIACDEDVVKEDGTRDTDWVNCVAWGPRAELICKYMKKGRLILIEGRPKTRTYEDKNGVKRQITELRVQNVYFADYKRDETAAPEQANTSSPKDIAEQLADAGFFEDIGDAELPF